MKRGRCFFRDGAGKEFGEKLRTEKQIKPKRNGDEAGVFDKNTEKEK